MESAVRTCNTHYTYKHTQQHPHAHIHSHTHRKFFICFVVSHAFSDGVDAFCTSAARRHSINIRFPNTKLRQSAIFAPHTPRTLTLHTHPYTYTALRRSSAQAHVASVHRDSQLPAAHTQAADADAGLLNDNDNEHRTTSPTSPTARIHSSSAAAPR